MLCICQPFVRGKIEKVPRGIRGEKSSKDMVSSRNLVSTIGAFREYNQAEIILSWPNIRTYKNFCVAHALFVDNLDDEFRE